MGKRILSPLLREDSVLSETDREILRQLYEEEGDGTWEVVAGDDPLDERRLKRNSYTYEELCSQPQKIRETISLEKDAIKETARILTQREIHQIYMVGCGDSLAALRGTRNFL